MISDSVEGIRGRLEAKWWPKDRKRDWGGTAGRSPRKRHGGPAEKKRQHQPSPSVVSGKEYLSLGAIHVEGL